MNILKVGFIVFAFAFCALFLSIGLFEFYIWKSHGFSENYKEIQRCIEHGSRWDYEGHECETQDLEN